MGKYIETYIFVFSFLLDHKVLGLRLSYLITMIDVPTLIFFFSADFLGDLYHFGVETFHVIAQALNFNCSKLQFN